LIYVKPVPDDLVTAIKSKLGKNFHAFEAVDERSHQAAAELAKRAAAKDISGSAKAFGRLADACVSCHKQFRATLRPLSN
jgi:cytochrome c556